MSQYGICILVLILYQNSCSCLSVLHSVTSGHEIFIYSYQRSDTNVIINHVVHIQKIEHDQCLLIQRSDLWSYSAGYRVFLYSRKFFSKHTCTASCKAHKETRHTNLASLKSLLKKSARPDMKCEVINRNWTTDNRFIVVLVLEFNIIKRINKNRRKCLLYITQNSLDDKLTYRRFSRAVFPMYSFI